MGCAAFIGDICGLLGGYDWENQGGVKSGEELGE